ncbi:hypothetical protein C2G38_2105188 [Gigaspora rosea]|uniref:Alpha/Beta hydrolase protein n=1 Tax=Gigaspora rosea TaxID=44941 RepID=A0A397UUF2_9GLOM|nr:hypothetical protein C2G38_2105188 [Gigaspora rosea]
MWTLDCSNHGDSAMLNQDILPEKFVWSDFARDILQLKTNYWSAHANFSKSKFFQSWDPEMLNLYVQYGLYELPSGKVTLKCSKDQEFVIYIFYDRSLQHSTFHQMSKIQCPTLFVVGDNSNFDYQDLAFHKMSQCQHSELISVDSGHLVS